MNLFKLFILGLALLAVTATQTKAFTASPSQVIQIDFENIANIKAYRSSQLSLLSVPLLSVTSSDFWANTPRRQTMLIRTRSITTTNNSGELCEPRPYVLVVHITPEVVYIGDIFSKPVHYT